MPGRNKSFGWMLSVCLAVATAVPASVLAKGDSARAALPHQPSAEEEQHQMTDPRIAWYRQAKFGMFIHWGLYCIPAGTWNGKRIAGVGEWIMNKGRIPVVDYEKLPSQFNPVKFDAERWVQMADDAGFKYITITSKHHEGFAMFHSHVSKYNIVDATPWHHDPMVDLAAACKRHNIKFCFYYSQAQDWHEPGGMGNDWDFPEDKVKSGNGSYDKYIDNKAIPQVKEILTQYGPIGLVWFDTPKEMNQERAQKFIDVVRKIQPACLINGRLGGTGDYTSQRDNLIPDEVIRGVWETPATMNDTWGYKTYDKNWKSPSDILHKLVDICSKGGNYLLNVGPTSEGVIPDPCPEILRTVGKWLKANGESIYGSRPTPFGPELKGKSWQCTTKPGKMFVHLFVWPGEKFDLHGLKSKITKAYLLLAPGQALQFTQSGDSASITLPAAAPDKLDSVLVLEN